MCFEIFPTEGTLGKLKSHKNIFFQRQKGGKIVKQNAFFYFSGFFVEFHTMDLIAMTSSILFPHTKWVKILKIF